MASKKGRSPFTRLQIALLAFFALFVLWLGSNTGLFRGDFRTYAESLKEVSTVFVVKENTDTINQDGSSFVTPATWIGTGGNTGNSHLGIKLSSGFIPKYAVIKSAKLDFVASSNSWIRMELGIYGDKAVQTTLSRNAPPSGKALTSAFTESKTDEQWSAEKTYSFDVTQVVQELVSQSERSTIGMIVKGLPSSQWGRKSIYGNVSSGGAPRLTVTYTVAPDSVFPSSTPSPTPTMTPTPNSTVRPSATPSPTIRPATPSPTPTTPVPPVTGGLLGSYYNNADFTSLALTRKDATVNFNWGTGSPASGVDANSFSVRWIGFVTPPQTGQYTFYTRSDDGVRLWVNDQLLIDNWTNHSAREDVGRLTLEAGKKYSIRLEYYDNSGRSQIQLAWSHSTFPKTIINASFLSSDGSGTPPSPIPTATPTPTSTPAPTVTSSPVGGGGGTTVAGESMALMAWSTTGKSKPNPKYDKCDDGTNIVDAHKRFFVVGPDGKKYPTWHEPVVTNPVTGSGKCYFGHEHGRNPTAYEYFNEIKQHFAFDANKNGTIESSELATAGIPFGYVNEQIEQGSHSFMRHEDHVGHKIEFANGEMDRGDNSDALNNSKTGGVVVPVKTNGDPKWVASGISCYHFHKVHQGVSTPDAFSNNMHEIVMHQKCSSTRSGFAPSTSILSGMVLFGAPGEFIKFCSGDRTTPVIVGKNADTQNLPGSRDNGIRNIITRDCIEQTVLVPEGRFSSFPYEIWSGDLDITRANGTRIAQNGGGWEVLDAIRYYNPSSPTRLSYMSDTCYEVLSGRRARGGACDVMTNYGNISGITWDDPRSAFIGIFRGQYIEAHLLNNQGGPEYWYSDPLGNNAQTTPFPGSIRQRISPVNTSINFSKDPRIIQREHSSGNATVHAPN